jgi:hypothetical protein
MACACLAHIEPSHTGLGLGIRTISQRDCDFEVNPMTYGVLHILPDRVALVIYSTKLAFPWFRKKETAIRFSVALPSCPRGAVRQQEETWDRPILLLAPGTQSGHRDHRPSTVSADLVDLAPGSSLRRTGPGSHQTIQISAHVENDSATPTAGLSDRITESSSQPSTGVVIFDSGKRGQPKPDMSGLQYIWLEALILEPDFRHLVNPGGRPRFVSGDLRAP